MEIIRPVYSISPNVPSQAIYSLSKKFDSGNMRVDKFSSGQNWVVK